MIVSNVSWDMKMSQGKSKTMPMQIFWGVEAVCYGIVQVVIGFFLFRVGKHSFGSCERIVNNAELIIAFWYSLFKVALKSTIFYFF